MNRLRSELTDLVAESTALLAAPVGVNSASTLLVTTGDNPERLHSEASFAALCGSLRSRRPQEAHSPLANRGGDRHANNALWRIAIIHTSSDMR